MRAMQLDGQAPIHERPLKLVELPIPEPGPGEVLLKVTACAICRTDLHVIEGDLPPQKQPIIPGHQIVGRVEKRGPECGRLQQGDRIGVAWLRHTCGQCRYCCAGHENLCAQQRFTGYHADGGYAEYTVVPEEFAYDIPAGLADVEATPLLCAGIIGYRALARSQLPPGGKLGIYGFGSSAHLVIQLAQHRGSEVYVITRGENHRQLAREMGAAWVGDRAEELPVNVDSAIIFAPAGELVPPALERLEKGGTLSLAGIYMSKIPPLEYERHLFYERNVCSVTANTREDGRNLLAEASEIPIRPHTKTYPLADANQALIDLKNDALRGTGVLVME